MSVPRRRRTWVAASGLVAIAVVAACAAPAPVADLVQSARQAPASTATTDAATGALATGEPDPRADDSVSPQPGDGTPAATSSAAAPAAPAGSFTIAFAGDVNFADRTADRLAANPATAFGVAAPGLAAADLTVVNLETAITTGGDPEPKSFTFRAPPAALTALSDAGVDVASMANNHGADYGATGLADTVAAIER